MITLLYQYEFGGDNLGLLYQYIFRSNNLILLMKCHMQVVVILKSDNFTLL